MMVAVGSISEFEVSQVKVGGPVEQYCHGFSLICTCIIFVL